MVATADRQYETKKRRVMRQMRDLHAQPKNDIGLNKTTSNLFRSRSPNQQRLNVRDFNMVLSVDKKHLRAEVEGMTTFEDFVSATLAYGLLPLVVPQLKTITVGGAVSGLGIESSSWKYGLVHEGVESMDVLLPDGQVVTARADNKYKDLFFGLPNSYGTLGYVLKLTIKLRPAKSYVRLQHLSFDTAADCFAQLQTICSSGRYEGQAVDFVDGVAFGPNELYLSLGFDVDSAPNISDYTYMNVYYRSIQKRSEDYLTTEDYIWRWDTDWFWCSKNVYANHRLVRRLLGRRRLGSKTYSQLMRFASRHPIPKWLQRLSGHHGTRESIIQDVEVTIDKAETFLQQFQKQIDIRPVWLCPTKATTKEWPYELYPMDPKQLYVNFGFWDSVATTHGSNSGYYNKKIEAMVDKLGGMKSLYSSVFYDRETFEQKYNYPAYTKLKATYDPQGQFKDLYEKCTQRS
jgi:FAD/FMN-containing dehydrogenase